VSKYQIQIEWETAVECEDQARRNLIGETHDAARVEAALLYACHPFDGTLPTAFVILQNGETEVYCYPETPER
jgi:hypothetical protein